MMLGWMIALAGGAQAEDVTAELLLQASPQDGLVSGFGARLEGDSAFFSVDGRGATGGSWIGRASGGVDVFGESERFDLTLGLFLGTTGSWDDAAIAMAGTGGFEFGVGTAVGPLSLRYRHLDGFRGPLESRLTENEFRLSFQMLNTINVFGQYINFRPTSMVIVDGYGAGVGMTF